MAIACAQKIHNWSIAVGATKRGSDRAVGGLIDRKYLLTKAGTSTAGPVSVAGRWRPRPMAKNSSIAGRPYFLYLSGTAYIKND